MLGGAFVAILPGTLEFLAAILFNMMRRVIGTMVSGLFTIGSMSVFRSLVERAPDEAIDWLGKAARAFRTPSGAWAVFVSDIMYTLTGTAIDPKPFLDLGIGPGSREAVQALGDAYLQPMLGLIMPRAGEVSTKVGIKPEDGLGAANRFFGVNLTFQMQAWLLHMLGDTFSFGMWKGMKDLPNAISWSFGIGWLSWLVMGTPFRMTIADPLERLYNRIYRPFRFSIAKLADAYWRGLISTSYFTAQMQELGIPDNLYDVMVEMERTKISNAEVYRLYRMGKLTWEQLVDHQHAQGHSPEDSLLLATEMTRREVGGLLEDVAKTAMKHYKDRRMSDSELRGFLREGGWTDEEAGIIIQDLQMQIALEGPTEVIDKVLSPAQIGRLYQQGEETRQWAETMLTKRRFRADEIPYFLKLYLPPPPKVPEPKEAPVAVVGSLYRSGVLSEAEARVRWERLDLTADYVDLLAKRYRPPAPPPPPLPREFNPTEIGRLYREKTITRAQALDRMTAPPVRMRREDAEIYLDTFFTPPEEIPPVPKEAPATLIASLYQRGLVSLDEAKRRWTDLTLSPDYITLMAMRWAPPVPPPPLPPREFSPTEIGRLCRDRVITRMIALERLEAEPIRFRHDDAVMYLDAFYAPIEEVVPPPKEVPAYVVGGLYKQGLETEAVFRSYLVELRYSDRAIAWLLEHYAPPVPPPPVPPREFTPSEIGRLWRDHYMTTDVAMGRLVGPKIRMTKDDAEMYLEAFYHPVEATEPPPREAPASVVGALYKNTQITLSDFEEHLDTLRYSPASKEFLIRHYTPPVEVPPPPLPPREFSPSVIGRLYKEQGISRSEALGRLTTLVPPMSVDDATIYLDILYTPVVL